MLKGPLYLNGMRAEHSNFGNMQKFDELTAKMPLLLQATIIHVDDSVQRAPVNSISVGDWIADYDLCDSL